jgi:hypothetical protein
VLAMGHAIYTDGCPSRPAVDQRLAGDNIVDGGQASAIAATFGHGR